MLFQLRNDTKKTGGLGLYRGFYNYYPGLSNYMSVSKNSGKTTPKWMVKIRENPMYKWMIWGVFPPIFGSTPI